MWLNERPPEMLREWLRGTSAPMLVTVLEGDGRILWCNQSFEQLLQYTSVEYYRDHNPITWKQLTIDRGDLEADTMMAQEVIDGTRLEYQLAKQYKRKDGTPCNVQIHVMRYPLQGGFECFLVTVYPLDQGSGFALLELQQIRGDLIALMERMPKPGEDTPTQSDRLFNWINDNPKRGTIAVVFVAFLLFGDRVLEVVAAIMAIFQPGTGG